MHLKYFEIQDEDTTYGLAVIVGHIIVFSLFCRCLSPCVVDVWYYWIQLGKVIWAVSPGLIAYMYEISVRSVGSREGV